MVVVVVVVVVVAVVAVVVVVAVDNILAVVEKEDAESFVSVWEAVILLVFAAGSQERGCPADLELVGG